MNIVAREKKIAYLSSKENEVYMYVMQSEYYNRIDPDKVISEVAAKTNISPVILEAAWKGMAEAFKSWATEGHSVPIPGLGTMRFGLQAEAVKSVEDVSTKLIRRRRLIFIPCTDIKQTLQNTSINITCVDRNGEVVKVKANDKDNVEDPENPDTTDPGTGGGSTTDGSGTGSGGSGSEDGNLE